MYDDIFYVFNFESTLKNDVDTKISLPILF